MKKLIYFLSFFSLANSSYGQIFYQNFDSTNVVSDYYNLTSPTLKQFNSISNYTYCQPSIVAGALQFTKTGISSGYFLRSTNLGNPNSLLIIKFKFTLSANASGGTNQIKFFIGSNFTEIDANDPELTKVHSRFGINFGATVGTFSIRDLVSETNSTSFSGPQYISMVVNNTGTLKNYLTPTGTIESVDNDKIDIWVGNIKVFDDINSTTSNVGLNNFKFTYPSNNINAIIDIDDFSINSQECLSQLFYQDFNSSSVVTDYVNSTNPSIGQFNSISNQTNNLSSINNGALHFMKTGVGSAYFTRTTALGAPNSLLSVKFKFKLSNNTSGGENQVRFFIGSNFTDDVSDPASINIHSKFGVNFGTTSGTFSIKDLVTGTNSSLFSDEQTITVIINNTGVDKTYLSPSGVVSSLANDKLDIWVGNIRTFNNINSTSSSVNLNNFKFVYPSNNLNATIDIDNIIITKLDQNLLNIEPIQKDVWIGMGVGGGGYLNGIQAGPTGIIMCNSDLSGTYISKDRGNSWNDIGNAQGLLETHACGMGFDPIDPTVFFIGTEGGIYRTNDSGQTFSKVYNGIFCTDIAISNSNHQIGYAGGNSKFNMADGVVYKTVNNGQTWQKVSVDLPTNNIMIQEIIINPTDPNILYAHSYEGRFATATKALYKSVNGGVNWTEIAPSVLRDEIYDIAIDPTNFQRMYASGTNIGVAKSIDGGLTWVTNKTAGISAIHIKSNMPNVVRAIQDWRYKESNDYGETWTSKPYWPVSYFLPGQKWAVKPRKGSDMSDPDTYFWWNSAWAWVSNDGSKTISSLWTKEQTPGSGWWITRGLENTIAWDIVISNADPNVVYAGYADMGMWRSLDHGQTWQSSNNIDLTGTWVWSVDGISKQGIGGNTKSICADPDRANVVWATIQGNQTQTAYLCKSTNFAKFDSWVVTSGLPATSTISGLSVDYNSSSTSRTLFVTADGNIYKSVDDGMNWMQKSSSLNCQFTLVDRFNSNYVYAGGNGGFYRSTDSGTTWTYVGLTEMGAVQDIKVDPSNPTWIYVVSFGTGKGLYVSKDNGLTWTKILTDDFLRGIAVDPQNPQNLYAASSSASGGGGYKANSKGILISRNGGINWTQANEGLAWPFAWCVEVDPKNPSFVFASMNGQSIKKRQFSDVLPNPLYAKSLNYNKDLTNKKITISPNPNYGTFKLNTDSSLQSLEIILSDITGKVLYKRVIGNQNSEYDISIPNLKSGIYILKVLGENYMETQKIIVK